MRFILKLIWIITYIPMGLALAFTMMLGIGVFLLLVDLFQIGYWIVIGIKPTGGEFPIGFFTGIYAIAALRVWIGEKTGWDCINIRPE